MRLSYYCIRRSAQIERLGLLERLDEDGLFGVHTFIVDGRRVSRDLLDSALELAFLDRHLGISRPPVQTILDIGAGYGRLAHRAVTAFPETVRYLCTDAIATSTFLCESYLGFRGVAGHESSPARVLPLRRARVGDPAGNRRRRGQHPQLLRVPSRRDRRLARLPGPQAGRASDDRPQRGDRRRATAPMASPC